MPCDSGVRDYGWSADRKADDLKRAVDELTAVLCEVCSTLERQTTPEHNSLMGPVMAAWWAKHKAYDKSQGRK